MRSLHVDTGKIWRGGQRQCNLLCRRLAKWGHETHLVCQPGSPLWQRAVETGLVLHPLRAAGETDPLAILKLARLLRRIGPELAAAHDAHGLGLLALARPLSGIAVPLVCHRRVDVRVARWPGSGWKMRRASMLICVSRRIADILEQCGLTRERIRVVHSGAPGIQPAREARTKLLPALGLEPDCTVLATVGGLIPHKGHRVLLEALRQLELARTSHQSPATSAQLHLVMIGDGPLRGQLRRQAAQAGLTARVHFLGDREDLETLFGAMDLYVHPSLTEGLGSSILDAFSAGVPVIASRTGGIPEIVCDGETGWLVEPGNPSALAHAIDRALADRTAAEGMAIRARRLFEVAFTDEAMARKTLDCYEDLLSPTRGGALS